MAGSNGTLFIVDGTSPSSSTSLQIYSSTYRFRFVHGPCAVHELLRPRKGRGDLGYLVRRNTVLVTHLDVEWCPPPVPTSHQPKCEE